MSSAGDGVVNSITALGTTAAGGYQLPYNCSVAIVTTCTSAAFGVTLASNAGAALKLAPWTYRIINQGVSALSVFAPTDTVCLINGLASVVVQPGQAVTIQFTSSSSGSATEVSRASANVVVTPAGFVALAGGAQPTLAANVVAVGQTDVFVATCATAKDSIALPDSPILSVPYTVFNGGAAALAVWPGTGGAESTIASLAANLPVFIGVGASAIFKAMKNTAGVVSWSMSGYVGPVPIIPGGATRPIATGEGMNGAIIQASQAAARVFTMPAAAAAAGLKFKFVINASAANTVTVTCPANTLMGVFNTGAAGAVTAVIGTSATSATFAVSQTLCGAFLELTCDGTNYYAFGESGIAAGFVTAP